MSCDLAAHLEGIADSAGDLRRYEGDAAALCASLAASENCVLDGCYSAVPCVRACEANTIRYLSAQPYCFYDMQMPSGIDQAACCMVIDSLTCPRKYCL